MMVQGEVPGGGGGGVRTTVRWTVGVAENRSYDFIR